MEITKVSVFKTSNDTFVGNGSVEFDECFFVRFKIVKSSKDGSLFISWPSTKGKDKETQADKYYPEAGYVLGDDEDTKYIFKNSVDEYIIKEYNKVIGISSTKDESKDKPKDGDKPAVKKGSSVTFGPKDKK
jgi:DNA-binding cell septation regulator SpoVG